MDDEEMINTGIALSQLDEYRIKEIAILLLSTTLNLLSVERRNALTTLRLGQEVVIKNM